MEAQSGRVYAVIQSNRCHQIFTDGTMPEWNENQIQVVDVTNNVPNVGDSWNGSSFEKYIPPLRTQQQRNKEADLAIGKLSLAALPDLIEVLTKLANGSDKAMLKVHDDLIKAEKLKKV